MTCHMSKRECECEGNARCTSFTPFFFLCVGIEKLLCGFRTRRATVGRQSHPLLVPAAHGGGLKMGWAVGRCACARNGLGARHALSIETGPLPKTPSCPPAGPRPRGKLAPLSASVGRHVSLMEHGGFVREGAYV